jgi:hypothetical protein
VKGRQQMKASDSRRDLPQAVVDLAQGDEAGIADDALHTHAAEAELTLSDLVADANGEIVIFNDSGFRTVAIRTGAAVVAEGEAASHVTASGEDVSGFKYVTFDNGVTLYFPEGLDLILTMDAPRPAP